MGPNASARGSAQLARAMMKDANDKNAVRGLDQAAYTSRAMAVLQMLLKTPKPIGHGLDLTLNRSKAGAHALH